MCNSISFEDLVALVTIFVSDDFEQRFQIRVTMLDWIKDDQLELALEEAVRRGLVVAYSSEADNTKFVRVPYRRYEGIWREEKYPCQFFRASKAGLAFVDSLPAYIWDRYIPDN